MRSTKGKVHKQVCLPASADVGEVGGCERLENVCKGDRSKVTFRVSHL